MNLCFGRGIPTNHKIIVNGLLRNPSPNITVLKGYLDYKTNHTATRERDSPEFRAAKVQLNGGSWQGELQSEGGKSRKVSATRENRGGKLRFSKNYS
jgi:hypothetical protein